jgi:hypothetical protein
MIITVKTKIGLWSVNAKIQVEETETESGDYTASLLSATKDGRKWKNIPWEYEDLLNRKAIRILRLS